jgi:IclR family acetate operon transcriptional repressor
MPGYGYVQSVLRAIDILEVIAGKETGISLNYLARALNLNRKTTHNLLRTLAHRGYLTKKSSPPVYRLGAAMDALRAQQARWTREVLLPAIRRGVRLSRKTRGSVVVSGFAGGEVLGRFACRGGAEEPFARVTFSPMPPYGSALAYEAFMDRATLTDYRAAHPMTDADADYWRSLDMVDDLLARVRAEGYLAFLRSGVFRVAAPVFTPEGDVTATISLTRPFDEMQAGSARGYIDMVRQSTRELSLALAERRAHTGAL